MSYRSSAKTWAPPDLEQLLAASDIAPMHDQRLSSGVADLMASSHLTLLELIEALRAIPYGRPSDRTVEGMIREGRGTCSTKHLYLAGRLQADWPETDPSIIHRVYRVHPADARRMFGAEVAATVPSHGLIDVHRYLTACINGRRIQLDVTLRGEPWDGRSSLPLFCGSGRDYPVQGDPDEEKRSLEAAYCSPVERESFIVAISRQASRGKIA
jgi:hypothetical protein